MQEPITTTGRLKVTLVKSVIGYRESQRLTVKSLGLRRIRQSVIHNDTPGIRGMVHKVSHLVAVEEVPADTPAPREQTGTQRFQDRIERRIAEREALMAALGLLEDEDEDEANGAQA
jgi:large subunit ribosomal protein L30